MELHMFMNDTEFNIRPQPNDMLVGFAQGMVVWGYIVVLTWFTCFSLGLLDDTLPVRLRKNIRELEEENLDLQVEIDSLKAKLDAAHMSLEKIRDSLAENDETESESSEEYEQISETET